MSEFKWFLMFMLALMLILVLSVFIMSQADQQDKQMCIDAGLRWEQTTEGIECVK